MTIDDNIKTYYDYDGGDDDDDQCDDEVKNAMLVDNHVQGSSVWSVCYEEKYTMVPCSGKTKTHTNHLILHLIMDHNIFSAISYFTLCLTKRQ